MTPLRVHAPPSSAPALRGISVVVPCLNEEASIADVIERANQGIEATGLPGEVIVVDNGSSDGSVARARAAGARVVSEQTRGYGAALRRGFAEAKHEYLVMADGDMSYDLAEMPPFIALLERGEADLVVGNRWGDMRDGAMPVLHRYVGNPVLSFLLRAMFRTWSLHDMHCGMRALRRSCWLELGCVTTGMEFASEMIVLAKRRGFRMRELPITYHPRVGESKLSSFRDGWRHLRFMLLHSPTWVLLVPGGVLWLASVALLLFLAVTDVRILSRGIGIHTMLVGGLLNVTSLQFLTIGFLTKAYAHLSGLRRDPPIERLIRAITFEHVIVATLPLVGGGLFFTLRVILHWVASGFGTLDEAKSLLLGILLLVDGAQVWAAGYLLSVMGLKGSAKPGSGP